MPQIATRPQDKKKKKADPRDLADPRLRDKHDNDNYGYTSAGTDERNKLFYYGVKTTDVYQGAIADCYLVSALSAVAAEAPELIEQGIIDNGDNTYRVRFFTKANYWSSDYSETWVTVDGDLPSRAGSDNPMYAKGQRTRTGGNELWPALYEKAFAEFKGGYNKMGEGGSTAGALEALSGSRVSYASTDTTPEDVMWGKLRKATLGNQAMAAGTYGEDKADIYEGTKLYPWHAYTVLGAYEKGRGKDKKRVVKLRNPWGRVEPGNDGKDDGIFELSLEDFMKFYASVNITNF